MVEKRVSPRSTSTRPHSVMPAWTMTCAHLQRIHRFHMLRRRALVLMNRGSDDEQRTRTKQFRGAVDAHSLVQPGVLQSFSTPLRRISFGISRRHSRLASCRSRKATVASPQKERVPRSGILFAPTSELVHRRQGAPPRPKPHGRGDPQADRRPQ